MRWLSLLFGMPAPQFGDESSWVRGSELVQGSSGCTVSFWFDMFPRTPLRCLRVPPEVHVPQVDYHWVRVRVTLQLTVSQSVCLGVEPNLGLLTRDIIIFFLSYSLALFGAPSLTRGRVCHLSVYSQSTVVSQYLHKIFTCSMENRQRKRKFSLNIVRETSRGRSVGIVRSRTKATVFSVFLLLNRVCYCEGRIRFA
jgi:hypothetical protein